MGIQKQEFYEGAALHQIIRHGPGASLVYSVPVFTLDARVQLHLKYCTGKRSPWGFTFTADEQLLLLDLVAQLPLVIGLVCGADGVVALPFSEYLTIANPRNAAMRISCFRKHRGHFEVWGPDGRVPRKIPSSDWRRV